MRIFFERKHGWWKGITKGQQKIRIFKLINFLMEILNFLLRNLKIFVVFKENIGKYAIIRIQSWKFFNFNVFLLKIN